MQELALEAEVVLHPVGGVAGHREVDRGEMDADLMRPPRLEPHVQERVLRERLDDLEPRDGVARLLRIERALRRVAPVTADRRVDPARPRPRLPRARARDIGARPRAGGSPPAARENASCDRATTRRPDVSRSRRWTIPGRSGIVATDGSERDELRRERSRRRSRARMHRDARRLVDDDEVLVLVGELHRDGLRDEPGVPRPAARPRRPSRARGDGSSARPPRRPSPRRCGDELLGERARPDLGARRERAVEPRAGVLVSDGEAKRRHRVLRASAASDRRERARRRGSRRRRR